jgi:hypothetical protein
MSDGIELRCEEDLPDIGVESLPQGAALGSFTTQGSVSSFSCPYTTAASASTYACLG